MDITTDNTKPLWLNLKKEYIDDNFEDFLQYMRNHCGGKHAEDVFFKISMDLMEKRVGALIDEMAEKPLYDEAPDLKNCDRDIRLLGCYLLMCPEGQQALSAYVSLMMLLAQVADARFADALLQCAAKRARVEKVEALGFAWEQVLNYKRDTFVYFAFNNVKFGEALPDIGIYQHKGCFVRAVNGLLMMAVGKDKVRSMLNDGVVSMTSDLGVGIMTMSGDRLRQQKERDVKAIHTFSNEFVNMLQHVKPTEAAPRKLRYTDGDSLVVRIVSKVGNMPVVESVDEAYETLKGRLVYKQKSLLYYRPSSQLTPYLREGDLLNAKVVDSDKQTFSIEDAFTDFMVRYARSGQQTDIPAVIIDRQPNRNFTVWLAASGIILFTDYAETDVRDDTARLEIAGYSRGPYGIQIDANVEEEDTMENIAQLTAREKLVRAFAEDARMPAARVREETEELPRVFLKLMLHLLFERQKQVMDPVDRYVMLCQARALSTMIGDELSAAFIRFTSKYLRALIQFVREGNIGDIRLEPDPAFADSRSAMIRMGVLQLLREYDGAQDSPVLQRTIIDFADSIPMLANIARLIQLSNGMKELVSDGLRSVVKRQIVKTLSLNTEEDADLEAANGNYLGVESDTVEFKKSFVYPPDSHMLPAPDKQAFNVLRGVCAFMNSTLGGTLYLGVNDSGYVTGVKSDMDYLRVSSIDSYMRYVQDKARKEMGLDATAYIKLESLYDEKVVAIHVEPHPFRLVELRKKAYLRINAESREMPENMRQQIIARKVFKDKDEAAALSMLQHAESIRKAVILHDYSSNNSGTISDRTIEPFQVITESGMVYGYNLSDGCCKMYSISRIGYVEILEQSWQHTEEHKPVLVDDFHMTGTTPIHVSLQLNLAARNLLVEEYPAAKAHLTADKNDENVYYYDADVYRMEGLARFYIGLASMVKIIEGEELKVYARDFCRKYIL